MSLSPENKALETLKLMRGNRAGAVGHVQRAERHALDAAIQALSATRAEGPKCPEGWVCVPRVPTPEMRSAARGAVWSFSQDYAPSEDDPSVACEGSAEQVADAVYRAMIAAVPQPPWTEG